MKSEVI